MGLSRGERLVLKSIHPEMLRMMPMAEWLAIVRKADDAGSLKALDGYAMEALTKAAQRSFGGNRSAAGAYAANIRWSRSGGQTGGGSGKIESERVSTGAANYEEIDNATNAAIGAASGSSERKELEEARTETREAKRADVEGRPLDAWERASQASFRVDALASLRGASMELRRLSNMLKQLVLDLTDAYYADR